MHHWLPPRLRAAAAPRANSQSDPAARRDVGATSSLRKRRAGEGNQGGTTAVDGVGSAAVGGELEALASGGVCCAVL